MQRLMILKIMLLNKSFVHQYSRIEAFIAFLEPENMYIDIQIVSLLCIEPMIWSYLFFHGGHLEIQDGRHKNIQVICVSVFLINNGIIQLYAKFHTFITF